MQDTKFGKISETVRDGFTTPHQLSGLPGSLLGCVYRADGSKVGLSERLGGYKGDLVETDNPDLLEPPNHALKLPGRGLYLGHYMGGHYGHFIIETLSTFWIFEQFPAEEFDYFLFHPFVFGTDLPSYAKYCLEVFGIDEQKIRFGEAEAFEFDELVVPERLFRLNHSADPRLKWVYDRIAHAAPPQPGMPSRLYLSRRQFSRTNFERVVANEVDIENAFRARGFEIVYPERLSFERQVALYDHADIVAGISGSGLHNSLLMRPDATLVELGDPRYGGAPAPTQVLCNSVSGVRSLFIPFQGRRFGPRGTMLFDMAFLQDRLDALTDTPPLTPRGPSPSRNLWTKTLERLEVAYLCTRPMLGSLVRDVLNWRPPKRTDPTA